MRKLGLEYSVKDINKELNKLEEDGYNFVGLNFSLKTPSKFLDRNERISNIFDIKDANEISKIEEKIFIIKAVVFNKYVVKQQSRSIVKNLQDIEIDLLPIGFYLDNIDQNSRSNRLSKANLYTYKPHAKKEVLNQEILDTVIATNFENWENNTNVDFVFIEEIELKSIIEEAHSIVVSGAAIDYGTGVTIYENPNDRYSKVFPTLKAQRIGNSITPRITTIPTRVSLVSNAALGLPCPPDWRKLERIIYDDFNIYPLPKSNQIKIQIKNYINNLKRQYP